MKYVLELDIKDPDDIEAAFNDAAVMVRCSVKGIRQKDEFRYLNGNSVRLLEPVESTIG